MSELDGISPKELAEFQRKHVDTHAELKAQSLLSGATSGQFRKKNNITSEPGDKNAKHVKRLKKPIERACMEKQKEDIVAYLGDAFYLRRKEVLNKKDIGIKDLLNTIAKFMPQKIDQTVDQTLTFADEIKRLTLEKKTYKAIDAED